MVNAVRLSGDSHWLPSDHNNIFFSKWRLTIYIAIMSKDIGKFVYDSMATKNKKDKNHEEDLTKNF